VSAVAPGDDRPRRDVPLAGRVAAFAVRRRKAVLAGSLALTLLSLLSLKAVRLDVELLSTLPTGTPAFDDFKRFLETFGALQTLPVLVSGPTGSELGRAIDALAAAYRKTPQVGGVIAGIRDGADMPLLDPEHVPAIVPAERFDALAARLQPDAIATALTQVKKILAMPTGREVSEHIRRDPLGLAIVAGETIRARYADPLAAATDPHILAPDGSAGLILLDPQGSPFDGVFTDALFVTLGRIEQELHADPAFAAVRVQYGGGYAHAHEDARLIKRDVYRYTLLAFVAVVAIFQIGYRNLGILPLIGYQLAAGSLFAFAASVVIFRQLNALSFCFAAIFYGLAIDAVIYFYSRLLEERRTAPLDEAIVRTCAGIGAANLVASLTTAAAFAVIGLSALGAVAQIGVLTAVGMVVNVANTFLVLPALVATFPGRLAARTPSALDTPRLGALAGASLRHPLPGLAVSIAIMVGWLAFRPPLPVDANVLHLRANDSEAAAAEDAIQAKFGGLAPEAQVLVQGSDLEDALQREERVVAWLEAHRAGAPGDVDPANAPRIVGYQALTTFLPSRAAERARRAAFAALPLARAREALHAGLVRQGFRVDAFADAERALTQPDVALPRDLDAAWIRPLVARHLRQTAHGAELAIMVSPAPGVGLAALRDQMRADLGSDVVVTGRALMEAALDDLISRELVGFTIASLVLNLIIVLLQVRSILLALAVMMPTGVIVLGMIEAMYALGIAFTPINLIVLPLTLGIGVDYCVYIVARWREGNDIATATRLVGRAAALTTMTTMAGFGFLAVSRYRGLAGLGWLAMIAIGLAFAAAICVLPAWLAIMPRRLRPGGEPVTAQPGR